MKKLFVNKTLPLLLVCVMAFGILAGCGAGRESTEVLSYTTSSSSSTMTITSKGDKIQSITQKTITDLSECDETLMKKVKEVAVGLETQLASYDNVSYTYAIEDHTMTEMVVIDTTDEKKVKELVSIGFLPISGGGGEDEFFISLENTLSALKDAGWKNGNAPAPSPSAVTEDISAEAEDISAGEE